MKYSIEKLITGIWYTKNPLVLLITRILSPFGYIYFFGSYAKKLKTNFVYKNTLINKYHIIIVGNITAGGTGKTPIVLFIAKQLQKKGINVAVITRGYGGTYNSSKPILIKKHFSSTIYSDEAILLANELENIPVVSCHKRENSISYIDDNFNIDVIISDDGLQYNALTGDTKIIVVDGMRGFGNKNYIPFGPLRNSISSLKKADQIIINNQKEEFLYQSIAKYNKNILLTKPIIKYVREIFGSNDSKILNLNKAREDILKYNTIHVMTAIGNPKKFFDTVLSFLRIGDDKSQIKFNSLPDHFVFTEEHFLDKKITSIYIMTSKDAVKLKSIKFKKTIRCFIIEIDTPFNMEFITKRLEQNNS